MLKKPSEVSRTDGSRVLEMRTRARLEVAVGFQAKVPSLARPLTILVNVVPPSRLTVMSTKSTCPSVRHWMINPPSTRNFSSPLGERSCSVGAGDREACDVFPSKPRLMRAPFGLDSLANEEVGLPESIPTELSGSAAKIPPCQLPAMDDKWKSSSKP